MTDSIKTTCCTAFCQCLPGWIRELLKCDSQRPECIICKNHRKFLFSRVAMLRCAKVTNRRVHHVSVMTCKNRACCEKLRQLIDSDPISKIDMEFYPMMDNNRSEQHLNSRQLTSVTCAACRRYELSCRKFSACGACRQVAYCSKACQQAHWKHHKFMCKLTQHAKSGHIQTAEEKTQMEQAKLDSDTRLLPSVKKAQDDVSGSTDNLASIYKTCSCMNQFERYVVKSARRGTCCRLGCTNKIVGPVSMSYQIVTCPKGTHMCALSYCCNNCLRNKNVGRGKHKGVTNPEPWTPQANSDTLGL